MKALTLKFDRKTIFIIILLIVIASMAFMWRPWEGAKEARTLNVIGEAEVKATPDEFLFTPYYERKGDDLAKLKTELDAFGNKLIEEVQKLGVARDNITLTSSNYGGSSATEPAMPGGKPADSQATVTLSVNIKTPTKELAQKVQNYLGSTDAKGQLTSQAVFSTQKRKELESQARDKAIEDAKSKADTMARQLNVSIGKVKEVKDSSRGGIIFPAVAEDIARDNKTSLPITPGTDTVSISLEIVFELK